VCAHAPFERVAQAAKKANAARLGLPTASDSAPEKERNENSASVYIALRTPQRACVSATSARRCTHAQQRQTPPSRLWKTLAGLKQKR
jgi:hypothetical protein